MIYLVAAKLRNTLWQAAGNVSVKSVINIFRWIISPPLDLPPHIRRAIYNAAEWNICAQMSQESEKQISALIAKLGDCAQWQFQALSSVNPLMDILSAGEHLSFIYVCMCIFIYMAEWENSSMWLSSAVWMGLKYFFSKVFTQFGVSERIIIKKILDATFVNEGRNKIRISIWRSSFKW